jgi:hypothetical protein
MTRDPLLLKETLNRAAKYQVDAGRANSFAEASEQLGRLRVHINFSDSGSNRADHVALLTAVNVARRTFLGGVTVGGDLSVPPLAFTHLGASLADAVVSVGGRVGVPKVGAPTLRIGHCRKLERAPFDVQVTGHGWIAEIVPSGADLDEGQPLEPHAAVAAACLGVHEAFVSVVGESADAGYRRVRLNLWTPDSPDGEAGPPIEYLPSSVWVLGVGHLGQALLWAMSALPYPPQDRRHVVLQDVDVVTRANISTSLLTSESELKRMKTRAVASWLEASGWATALCERRFTGNLTPAADEPQLLFVATDNIESRRALDTTNFPFAVEAGIGNTADTCRNIRLHTFPNERKTSAIWPAAPRLTRKDKREDHPAYMELDAQHDAGCGVMQLMNTAVGLPFVGGIAGSLMLSEALRLLHGGQALSLVDYEVRGLPATCVPNGVAPRTYPGEFARAPPLGRPGSVKTRR